MSGLTPYVVGFLYNPEQDRVLLIRKNRPRWQRGLLNGVGGHVEEHELFDTAMEREFKEETGLTGIEWQRCLVLYGTKSQIVVYRAVDERVYSAQTTTDEAIGLYDIEDLPLERTVPNLQWMVPMLGKSGLDIEFPLTISFN